MLKKYNAFRNFLFKKYGQEMVILKHIINLLLFRV